MSVSRRDFISMAGAAALAHHAFGRPVRSLLGARELQYNYKNELSYDAKVEWLESTGTQYIDTGVTASNHVGIEIDCSDVALGTWLVGGRVAYRNGAVGFYRTPDGRIRPSFGFEDYNGSYGFQRHILAIKNGAYYADGVLVHQFTAQTFSNNSRIYVFNLDVNENGDPSSVGLKGKVYGVRILYDTSVVRDFQPVRFTNELGQSEGAMYDHVSGQLFRNQGTDSFIIGPDI